MNATPQQIVQFRSRLLDLPRPQRLYAAAEIALHRQEPWSQGLLLLGLQDPAPDVVEFCIEQLCLVKPSRQILGSLLNAADADDAVRANGAEKILRCWAPQYPGLIRILAFRGLNRRSIRILIDTIARIDTRNYPEHAEAFRQIAPLLPPEIFKLREHDYDGSVHSLELLARLLPYVRGNRQTLDLYLAALAHGPMFWLGDQILETVLSELAKIYHEHPLVSQLLEKTSRQALSEGNYDYLNRVVPIVARSPQHIAKGAMLIAEIVSHNPSGSAEADKLTAMVKHRIQLYGITLTGLYCIVLRSECSEERMMKVLHALKLIGVRARKAVPELVAVLRQAQSDHLRLAAIEALSEVGFHYPSEAIAQLTLSSLASSEQVQDAAINALKRWYKAPELSSQAAAAESAKPAGKLPPNFPLNLADQFVSMLGLRLQGCFTG